VAGCMFESPISIAAMASFISGKKIDFIDLDTIHMIKNNPVIGSITLEGPTLILSDKPGLGIDNIQEFQILHEVN